MPRLDQRLQAVAQFIRSDVHVDIGSDHGHLLLALLKSGRIRHGIAVENKKQPWANSNATLAEVDAEVRFGDGLGPLKQGEADSLSICGIGGTSLVKVLEKYPFRIPKRLVLQPNEDSDLVRRWAYANGYHLTDEVVVGRRLFDVLVFDRVGHEPSDAADPAYEDVDLDAGFLFGPWNIRRRSPIFTDRLRAERVYYSQLPGQTDRVGRRLNLIDRVLNSATRG